MLCLTLHHQYLPNMPQRCSVCVLLAHVGLFIAASSLLHQGERESVPQWVELANGCLCCSVKAEFVQALEALLDADGGHSGKFDYVLVETTGEDWVSYSLVHHISYMMSFNAKCVWWQQLQAPHVAVWGDRGRRASHQECVEHLPEHTQQLSARDNAVDAGVGGPLHVRRKCYKLCTTWP